MANGLRASTSLDSGRRAYYDQVYGETFRKILAASTTKKMVYVRRFGQDSLEGYVDPQQLHRRDGIEVLSESAESEFVPFEGIRAVYFIRKFGQAADGKQRKVFSTRPKLGGLWVRLQFVDGEELEGVIPNDLRIMGRNGVMLTPPDSKGNAHSVFVPGPALERFVVMGVIGKPTFRRTRAKSAEDGTPQMPLFPS